MSLADHVGDGVNPAVLVRQQLQCGVSNRQRNGDRHVFLVDGPL